MKLQRISIRGRCSDSCGGFGFVAGVFDKNSGAGDNFVHKVAFADLVEGNAQRVALPVGWDAGGIRTCCGGGVICVKFYGQHRFAGRELGNDGIEVFAAGGEAAVCAVVAEPRDLADAGFIIGKLEGGDTACEPVHHEPRTTLPYPVLTLSAWFVTGQGVVEAHSATDDESAVGNV